MAAKYLLLEIMTIYLCMLINMVGTYGQHSNAHQPVCKAWHERRQDSWGSPNPAPNGQQAAPFGAAFLVWGSLSMGSAIYPPPPRHKKGVKLLCSSHAWKTSGIGGSVVKSWTKAMLLRTLMLSVRYCLAYANAYAKH